ncbi:MAG: permease, partial [Chloroflexi bacterium]|nr:permease [Chloroflexota bacterium]
MTQLASQHNHRAIKPADRLKLAALALLAALLLASIGYQAANTGREYMLVLSVFATRFLGIFVEAVPFLLLGSITSGLIETFIKSDDIMRFLPRNRLGAAIGGAFLGLVFPVCECGVVPVARRLFKKGMPVSLGVAFLLAAPFMNPIVFASTYIAFGFGPI